jgi:hypothetical protein
LKRAILVAPAVTVLVFALCFWQSMHGSDDLGYAEVAMSNLLGEPALLFRPDFHVARLGVLGPLTGAFWLFGPNNLSMAIVPLICTVLTVVLVTWLGDRFWGRACGLTAGFLYALQPLTIDLSTYLTPEPLATLAMCAAAVLVVIAIDRPKDGSVLRFGAGLLIGIAYLTTEVGALMLPVLCLYIWLAGKGSRRDVWLIAGFAVVLGAELTYHAIVHGNALYRFTFSGGYSDDPMVSAANSVDRSYRLFKAYPALYLYPNLDFGVLGLLMAAGGFYGLHRWRERSLFVIWAATIVLFYNFMSASLTHYVVTPVAARHVAPASVPLLILAAKLLVDIWEWARKSRAQAVRLCIPLLLVLSAIGVVGSSLLAMYANTAPMMTDAMTRNAELVAGFLRDQSSVTVVSDRLSLVAIQFYRGYNTQDVYLKFDAAVAAEPALASETSKPVFVVLNGPILNEERITGEIYGGVNTIRDTDRQAIDRLVPAGQPAVFSARFQGNALLQHLFQYGVVRQFAGPYAYRLSQTMLVDEDDLNRVRVFRYAPSPADASDTPNQARSIGAPSDQQQ